MRPDLRPLLLTLLAMSLAGCGGSSVRDSAPRSGSVAIPDLPADPTPRAEPPSRYGNGPEYEVFGKRYTVMPTSHGYRERGVASWYGQKFHGNLTSNRETYDMYEMTAAHKSLPLPTYVRVTNLSNDKSVIVRVNDRGPFVHNRIIDLSYGAALKLDMIKTGTSLVEVEAISFDKPTGDRPVRQVIPAEPAVPDPGPAAPHIDEDRIFLQVGAFGSRDNAERRLAELQSANILSSFVVEDTAATPALYRVRIGPIRGIVQYDMVVEELRNLGITDPYLVNQ
jgi:rare lipoprotein A